MISKQSFFNVTAVYLIIFITNLYNSECQMSSLKKTKVSFQRSPNSQAIE